MMRVLPWVLAVLLALGCVSTIVYAVRQERESNAAVSREIEAGIFRETRLAGVVLVEQKRAQDVEAELAKAMERNADLEAAVERARKASPGARPVAVVQASTGPLVVSPLPPQRNSASSDQRPCHMYAIPGATCLDSPMTSEKCVMQYGELCVTKEQASRPCLLFEGDTIELRVDEALLETRAGNQLVAGAASVWHLDPEYRIAGGPFEAKVSTASGEREVAPGRVGWGVGPSVWGSSSGLAYGAVLSPPPLDLWRLQVEVAAGLGFGAGGVSGSAAVLGRVR